MEKQANFLKWETYFKTNKKINKELIKIKKNTNEFESFFEPMQIWSEKVVSTLGLGYNKINEISIRLLIAKFLNNLTFQNSSILIAHNGNKNCAKVFNYILENNFADFQFATFSDDAIFDRKVFNFALKKTKSIAGIFIQSSQNNDSLIEINFVDERGQNFSTEFLSNIQNQILSFDEFKKQTESESQNLIVDTELIIEAYASRILHMSHNLVNPRITKITISNHNSGTTEIFAKIFGNLDYSYRINKKTSSFNKAKTNLLDDKKMIQLYAKEILIARKNQSNLLITFNENGDNLLMFLIYRNQTIFIDETKMSLIFLHNFFKDIKLRNKKLPDFFISSDIPPSGSLQSLINRHKVLHVIKDKPENLDKLYLLYYSNSYNQYSFGEVKNSHFGNYHLVIKFLEIINYFHIQNSSVNKTLKQLKDIYGSENQIKIFKKMPISRIESILNKLNESEEKRTKININEITNYTKNTNNCEEILLSKINFGENNDLVIKYNNVIKSVVFIFRKKINKKNNFFIKIANRHEAFKQIKKILKDNS